jgi:hypothetical protein
VEARRLKVAAARSLRTLPPLLGILLEDEVAPLVVGLEGDGPPGTLDVPRQRHECEALARRIKYHHRVVARRAEEERDAVQAWPVRPRVKVDLLAWMVVPGAMLNGKI